MVKPIGRALVAAKPYRKILVVVDSVADPGTQLPRRCYGQRRSYAKDEADADTPRSGIADRVVDDIDPGQVQQATRVSLEADSLEVQQEARYGARGWCRHLAWLPIPLLLVTMAMLWAADLPGSYGSDSLIMTLNFIFLTLASGVIVYLVSRSFLTVGARGC